MEGDFGARLESALSEHVAALREAAAESRRLVDEEAARLAGLVADPGGTIGITDAEEK